MAYIGSKPADKALTSDDIADSIITSAKIADGTIASADLASGVGGKILQVVTATDSTQRSTTSTSFVTASNTLSVAITPSSTSNKVFLIASFSGRAGGDYVTAFTIYRDATNLGGTSGMASLNSGGTDHRTSVCMSYLDSPSSTSSLTYQVYFKTSSGTGYLTSGGNQVSSITAFEVSA